MCPNNQMTTSTANSQDPARTTDLFQVNQASSISLPKGGGAIKGIDEKFQVNPSTGTASVSIAIRTSPNRSGFQPGVSLSYDSGSGNGPFGLGWHLNLPSIVRKTDQGIPRYHDSDNSDVFILSGAEDLVVKLDYDEDTRSWKKDSYENGEYYIQRYRPRIEGLYARIEKWRHKVNGEIFWKTISQQNITSIFGKNIQARICDPENDNHIFQWLLEETYDDKGNIIIYEYQKEDDVGVNPSLSYEIHRLASQKSYANRYIKRIQYGNQVPFEKDNFHFITVFDYGDQDVDHPTVEREMPWPVRSDPFSSFRSGFEIRTQRLCKRVLMFHDFAELGETPCLVFSTDFEYKENSVLTKLISVTQTGYRKNETGSYHCRSYPPVEFAYSEAVIGDNVEFITQEDIENLPVGIDHQLYQWLDLDGEGLSGILSENEEEWYYKRNLGGGRFAPVQIVKKRPSTSLSSKTQACFMDLEGDGEKDLVLLDNPVSGFYERSSDQDWDTLTPFALNPNVEWNDPNLRMIDLTGDGLADLLISEDAVFTWYASAGEKGFGPAEAVQMAFDEQQGPNLVFSNPDESIFLADMTGDGLGDIVRIRNGEVCYWSNKGYGHFGEKVLMGNAPWFDIPDQYNPNRIRLTDIDGSGTTDIIYIGSRSIILFFNQAGNVWSEPNKLDTFPDVDNHTSVHAIDLLGYGTSCLVWSSPIPAHASRPLRYVHLMSEGKPHLLKSIDNNMGKETRLDYCPSTQFYLEDQRNSKPWITRLPFVVHVVSRVEVFDAITQNRFVSLYAYHHGYFDGKEREFRGFGMVEQWDTEDYESFQTPGLFTVGTNALEEQSHVPPVYTKTWYHTGFHENRASISNSYQDEYYTDHGDSWLLPDTLLPEVYLNPDEEREACRALKGRILRQEIYALDQDPEKEHIPYQVSERSFQVRHIQPKQSNSHAVFDTHEKETLQFIYERRSDNPRISHHMILDVDPYGHILESVNIGYGRTERNIVAPDSVQEIQSKNYMTCSKSRVVHYDQEVAWYRLGLPVETQMFEITGPLLETAGPYSFAEVKSLIDTAAEISYEAQPETGISQKRCVDHRRLIYRSDDLITPLLLGHADSMALTWKSYSLAFSRDLIEKIFGDRVDEDMLREEGGYEKGEDLISQGLFPDTDNETLWWIPTGKALYPEDREVARNQFYLPTAFKGLFEGMSTVVYDPYYLLPLEACDAVGNRLRAQVDYRILKPWEITDPNGNRSQVAVDILGQVVGNAVMGKASESIGDSLAGFEPDLSEEIICDFIDHPSEITEDLLKSASTRTVHDIWRFQRSKDAYPDDPGQWQPVVVSTMTRVPEESASSDEDNSMLYSFAYSDGFGREIQTKVPAEPGPAPARDPETGNVILVEDEVAWTDWTENRWIGSGRTIYDNKGNAVKRYEPFFSDTHLFEKEKILMHWGVSPVMHYDPLNRLVRTDLPNGTFSDTEFDNWCQILWDANDRISESQWYDEHAQPDAAPEDQHSAELAFKHNATPTTVYFDSLGRPFHQTEKNTILDDDRLVTGIVDYHTHQQLDIEGKQLTIHDARGNCVVSYLRKYLEGTEEKSISGYDVLNRPLYQKSMDSGELWILQNVAQNPIRIWDNKGHIQRFQYDAMQRLTHVYIREEEGERLAAQTIFGESNPDSIASDPATDPPCTLNLRGKIYQQYDDAGVSTNIRFDFRGNLLESQRQLLQDYMYPVNWDHDPELEESVFNMQIRYDRLNRATQIIPPHSASMMPNVIQPVYNKAGLPKKLDVWLHHPSIPDRVLDPLTTDFHPVKQVEYDEKGQCTHIEYGNNIHTDFHYDPLTFQLVNLMTSSTSPDRLLQNLMYHYDPIGNLTEIRDEAQQTVFFDNSVVEPHTRYEYDALYRLIFAEGREHAGQAGLNHPVHRPEWKPQYDFNDITRRQLAHPQDGSAMRNYSEQYFYDQTGNLLRMHHHAGENRWSRLYDYHENNNRLRGSSLPGDDEIAPYSGVYDYDENGNMIRMPHLSEMIWDSRNQLREVDLGGGGRAYYVYNSKGQRIRKIIHNVHGVKMEERIYLGGFEIYRKYNGRRDPILERETLHIMHGEKRVALVETQTRNEEGFIESPDYVIRYQLDNHLGSASLEIDVDGNVISYEEYYPFGSTSYQAVRGDMDISLKRYRYTGMERDEETGLNYHTARYYAPWLGRWTSPDPMGMADGPNLYVYCGNNPIMQTDAGGTFGGSQRFRLLDQDLSPPTGDPDLLFQGTGSGNVFPSVAHEANLSTGGCENCAPGARRSSGLGNWLRVLAPELMGVVDWIVRSRFFERGGGTTLMGLTLLGLGLAGILSGGSAFIIFAGALAFAGGTAGTVTGGIQLGLTYSGTISDEQSRQLGDSAFMAMGLSSPGGMAGAMGSLFVTGSGEHIRIGITVGSLVEGGGMLLYGGGRLLFGNAPRLLPVERAIAEGATDTSVGMPWAMSPTTPQSLEDCVLRTGGYFSTPQLPPEVVAEMTGVVRGPLRWQYIERVFTRLGLGNGLPFPAAGSPGLQPRAALQLMRSYPTGSRFALVYQHATGRHMIAVMRTRFGLFFRDAQGYTLDHLLPRMSFQLNATEAWIINVP